MRHNGQVCYLRAALNQKFKSNSIERFEIDDIENDVGWSYIGNDSDKTQLAYIADEKADSQVEKIVDFFIPDETVLEVKNTFVITVPTDLYESELPVIRRFVNKYRLVTRVPLYKPQTDQLQKN